MRETERSLRAFFIIVGAIGIWVGVKDLRDALALPALPLQWTLAIWIPVLLNLMIAPAILYAGLKLKTVLLSDARWVHHVLVLSGALFVFELALGLVIWSRATDDFAHARIVSALIGGAIRILIIVYLYRSVTRLAREARTRAAGSAFE